MGITSSAAQPHITALPRQPRGGIDVASELRRLMPRDRWLLELLNEHQVFTTEQVAALGFDHIHTARNRLVLLNRRGILARFRDGARPGSQQWRWTLDLIGAAWIAARAGEPEPKPAVIRRRINRLASWPGLAHRLGTNGFFVDLAAHARHTAGPDAMTSGTQYMRIQRVVESTETVALYIALPLLFRFTPTLGSLCPLVSAT
jgi:hypothetical protein